MSFASDARKVQQAFNNQKTFWFRTRATAKKFSDSVEEAIGMDVRPVKKRRTTNAGSNTNARYSVTVVGLNNKV